MAISAVPQEFSALLRQAETLAPAQVKEWVKTLTGQQLDQLMVKMDTDRAVPEVFKSADVMAALEARMEQLGVSRDKLTALRTQVEETAGGVSQKAEDAFKAELFKKGGGLAVLGTVAISVLSWLGFKKFKKLKESLTAKGFLRTAAESAIEHPILAVFLTALGIRAGTDAYKYFTENREAIETHVAKEAEKSGKPAEDIAKSLAERARDVVTTGADQGLRGIVKGLTYAFGGNYDEETGVVTLPHSTLRPPVIVAWQAGVRRNGTGLIQKGFSRFVVEDRLQTLLKETRNVQVQHSELALHKRQAAARALELLKQGALPGGGADGEELDRIFRMLETELQLDPAKAVHEVRTNRADVEKRVTDIQDQMQKYLKSEAADFKTARGEVQNIMYEADQKIAKGEHGSSVDDLRNEAVRKSKDATLCHQQALADQKIAFGKQLEGALNDVAVSMDDHLGGALDKRHGGADGISRTLEGAVNGTQKLGYSFVKVPGGKWVMRSVVGYSFLPLAMEGIAALRPGEEGEAAKKAFALDAGEAVGGFIPGVGEFLDFKSAIMGTDLNGRELGTWDRVVAGTMGTLGTASIVAGFFTGGTSIVAFRALRGAASGVKAINIARKVDKGITVAGVTAKQASKVLKLEERAKDSAQALSKMAKLTDAQRVARKVQWGANNLQRVMQVTTYGHLGYQLASGAVSLYENADAAVSQVQQGAVHAIDSAEQFFS